MGLDDLETNHEHVLFFRIFLTMVSFFVVIVMLNLLIAIMGDTFDRVLEQKKEQALREICSFIESYIFTAPRIEREFLATDTIIIVSKEQKNTASSDSWDGKMSALKAYITESMNKIE